MDDFRMTLGHSGSIVDRVHGLRPLTGEATAVVLEAQNAEATDPRVGLTQRLPARYRTVVSRN